tara:strand:+ start:298 stop:1767 length:1470 start_codon:yes stop_codon:yes gene_type:complete
MDIVDNSGKGLAALGRNEDRFIAHVAKGEMVVPPVISDKTKSLIKKEMRAVGLDPQEYEVGIGMSINPITGQAEFGFLKKMAKRIKKVVKKVAPVAAVIPGPWQPFAAVYQKGNAALKLAKGEGGLGDIMTVMAGGKQSVFGKSGALNRIGEGFAENFGAKEGFLGSLKNIGKVGGKFNPVDYGKNVLRGIASDQKQGYGGLFGGNVGTFNPNTGMMEYLDAEGNITTKIADVATQGLNPLKSISPFDNMPTEYVDVMGNTVSAEEYAKLDPATQTTMTAVKPDSGVNIGRSILGKGNTPDFIKAGEDLVKGFLPGGEGSGGLGGINPQMAALALLYGKAVKDAAKRTEGGLTDIRQSVRPDLNPAPVFSGFDLGIRKQAKFGGPIGFEDRPKFNQGGLAAVKELDMRQGGESVGPGTGTSDDIPAMLSDGEYVMTASANRGAGGFDVNKTKKGLELIASGKPDRENGVNVMDKLMDFFEDYDKIGGLA